MKTDLHCSDSKADGYASKVCGRFTLTQETFSEVAIPLVLKGADLPNHRPRYNVAPGNQHVIVRASAEGRVAQSAVWGIVEQKHGRLLINARCETAAQKPTFRNAYRERRCVVPADGFIEWFGSGSARRPMWFRRPDKSLVLFAGLFEEVQGAIPNFVILTTAAVEPVSRIHDRMPVVIGVASVDAWLSGASDPSADATPLEAIEVNQRINSIANDDAACLLPPKQLAFF